MINRPNADRTVDTPQSNPQRAESRQANRAARPDSADDTLQIARSIAEAASDRKAVDVAVLDVAEVSYLADYFVVMTGLSNVQVRAIARSIQETVEETWNRTPQHIEGTTEGNWILLDYGDVIAHVFMPHEREYYSLEAFWGHAQRIDLATAS